MHTLAVNLRLEEKIDSSIFISAIYSFGLLIFINTSYVSLDRFGVFIGTRTSKDT